MLVISIRQCYQEPIKQTNMEIESRKKGLRIEEEVAEEEDDTLSLSDLPIYDVDSEEWKKYYDSKSTSSSTSSDSFKQDFFEFVSEEWNKNAISHHPPENILFCGKLIPYRNPIILEDTKKDANEIKIREKRGFSSLRSASRWSVFLFGTAGIPTKMELKDLKNRQSRKIASSSPSSTLCPLKNGDEKARGSHEYGRDKGKGMWSLIKSLSCSSGASYHAQSVVKASIGCISLV